MLNAYLPRLAASSLPSSDRGDTEKLSRATARISSHGIALGYTAGILLLLATLLPVQRAGGSTDALRFAIGGSGAWWALFSIPALLLLPGASGIGKETTNAGVTEESEGLLASEAASEAAPVAVVEWSVRKEVVDAWRRLGHMLRWQNIRRLRNTFRYLAAWFLLSDGMCPLHNRALLVLNTRFPGFTTLTSTALLFAKTTLHMPPSSLVLVGVLSPSAGILGALLWPVVQRRLGLTSLRVLVLLVAAASAIPLYGIIGLFAPHGARWGLRNPAEMFVLAVYFGALYGAFQSYARALYAEIIPPGEEARWYGLFSITDKVRVFCNLRHCEGRVCSFVDSGGVRQQSSSFIGPLVVGLVADLTGNIRYAFVFLVVMLWAALPVLAGVDVERGRADARAWSSENDGHESEGDAAAVNRVR